MLACLALAAAAYVIPFPLEPKAHATFAILVLTAGLWVTESIPLGASALLVPVLGTALGTATVKEAFAGFGDPIVFLFLGTFLLTDAAARHGMDRRLAGAVLGSRLVRGSPRAALWAVALIGCSISAFLNNTATTALLLPLALHSEKFRSRAFLTSVLLVTSYAPSIGGTATPVGTAPNLIGRAALEKATGAQIPFLEWTLAFAPLALLMTALTAGWLHLRGGRLSHAATISFRNEPRPWTRAEKTLLPLFLAVVLLWVTPGVLKGTGLASAAWVETWSKRLPEASVPLLGAALLFLIPTGEPGGARVADATVFRRIDWSTILLFGGGISLGSMLESSGLARTLGQGLFDLMPTGGTYGIILAATLMAIVVSEFTSNTASASLVVPVVISLARAAGTDPVAPALAATVGCSFGFMLPVSTPPNALVYATGRITIPEMVRAGFLLDVAGALAVSGWVWLVFG
ncbi:MAG: Sodium-dependent dicarboxylate transporter SdcS [Planctomycetes bacterium]|nr:Sodium-dependent dicarboxylate transporter SdcS [Planctomycetota bacterium]